MKDVSKLARIWILGRMMHFMDSVIMYCERQTNKYSDNLYWSLNYHVYPKKGGEGIFAMCKEKNCL